MKWGVGYWKFGLLGLFGGWVNLKNFKNFGFVDC